MRRLIINADDFGLTAGINRAVIEGHQHGVITSATLMANGSAFADAVASAQTIRSLAVGCHIVLLDGKPVSPTAKIPGLMRGARDGSSFPGGLARFTARALTGRIDPQQVEIEATAQFRRIQAAGISVSHFDTHKHTHMFPAVLRPLLKSAGTCGVRAVRNPFPPLGEMSLGVVLSRAGLWRYAQLRFLHRFASDFRQAVEGAGLFTPDGTVGIAVIGSLDQELFRLIVERLPEGTWELVCHPGYHDTELDGVRTRLKASRQRELEVLTSSAAQEVIACERIELISYPELVLNRTQQKNRCVSFWMLAKCRYRWVPIEVLPINTHSGPPVL